MTTIFGLRHPQVDAAVLVEDRQVTQRDRLSGMPMGKYLARKLWTGKGDQYCFGQVGDMNPETQDFMKRLAEEKYDIEQITKKKYFPELRKLNIKRMGRQNPNLEQLSSVVIATRFDNKPKLFTCYPLGEVGERIWTAVGSGKKQVEEYMEALQTLSEARNYDPNTANPTMSDVIRVGLEAVRRAQSQDIYSHGLDMLVCTPNGINDHFAELGDDFGIKLKKIQGAYEK